MTIYLIGTGCGAGTLTKEAADAVEGAGCLIGAERLLAMFPDKYRKTEAVLAEDILARIRLSGSEVEGDICVLFSGDSGFYSGTRRLLPLLEDYEVRILPGISSLQVFAARCGRPWQDWRLCTAHGTDCDAVKEVCRGGPVFFLTGGKLGPDRLCKQLAEAGLDTLPVVVGSDLGTDREEFFFGDAGSFSGRQFPALSVMLAEEAPRPVRRTPGLPDSLFMRTEHVPMTKQFVRAAILSALAPGPDDVCWDIGAGTGSVAIELALHSGAVYGVEKNAEALELAEKNRRALGAWNLRLVGGAAPEALRGLPAPDVVFIGGSEGKLEEILEAVTEKNRHARIAVSAVTVETPAAACGILERLGFQTEIIQIGVGRSRKAGRVHLMTAQNPVWLITGNHS